MGKLAIFIDTNLWIFAQKIPDPSTFPKKSEFEKMHKNHKLAKEFLLQKIEKSTISMTYHQFCEIYHALGFRGTKLPKDQVRSYCSQLFNGTFMRWYQISLDHVKKAMTLSNQSGIHIWEYLCVLPLYDDVEALYTCDTHFKDASFQSLGPSIENPTGEWLVL